MAFGTDAGTIEAEVRGADVKIRMTDPFDLVADEGLEVDPTGPKTIESLGIHRHRGKMRRRSRSVVATLRPDDSPQRAASRWM